MRSIHDRYRKGRRIPGRRSHEQREEMSTAVLLYLGKMNKDLILIFLILGEQKKTVCNI